MKVIGERLRRVTDGIAVRQHFAEITTGAEESALGIEHHYLDLRVVITLPRRAFQLAGHLAVEAIGRIGPVQGNARDRALLFKDNAFEIVHGHGTLAASLKLE